MREVALRFLSGARPGLSRGAGRHHHEGFFAGDGGRERDEGGRRGAPGWDAGALPEGAVRVSDDERNGLRVYRHRSVHILMEQYLFWRLPPFNQVGSMSFFRRCIDS